MSIVYIVAVAGLALAIQPSTSSSTDASRTAAPAAYHVIRTMDVGGEGGWDCIEVDSVSHHLFIPHATHVVVLDTQTGKQVGDIAGTSGVHDVAIAAKIGKGFTSNGKTDDVSVFDLATLKVEKTIKCGKNPDIIVYEPTSNRVFCFNGRGNDATVISADDLSVVVTIALGGKPEFAKFDGEGYLFVNIEDTSEIVKIDVKTMKVDARFSLAPGSEPTGLAIDPAHHLLFAACGNEKMVVLDYRIGKVIATPPIGKSPDGAAFDPAGDLAVTFNGEGTMTVVSTTGEHPFSVIQTLSTAKGARTGIFDPSTHHFFLPTADFESPAAGDTGKRPKMKPGTFKVIEVGV